jgi:hypothetical protein
MGYPSLAKWKQVAGASFVFGSGKCFNLAVAVHYTRSRSARGGKHRRHESSASRQHATAMRDTNTNLTRFSIQCQP